MTRAREAFGALAGICLCAAVAVAAEPTASLKQGKAELKSAGPLAFGPEGILFVGDTRGAALFAIDTGDHNRSSEKRAVKVEDLSRKIADMLGTKVGQIQVNDLAVNPLSGNVYLSISRGRGPEAIPMIVRINAAGQPEEFSLEKVRFARTDVPNAPSPEKKDRGQALRNESITDLAYVDGRVFLAGLSNEEFSSRLIAIPFPFSGEEADGASIEIYHGAHGRVETKSPIRTFAAYRIDNEPYLMAAYTCTPLVKVPVASLKAGAHVKGTTIAELGNRNRPLDMIVYRKDGKDFIFMTNNSRGVMKIRTEGAGTAEAITAPVRGGGTRGLGYETIGSLKGVVQMDQLDDHRAVIITENQGKMDLETIDLP